MFVVFRSIFALFLFSFSIIVSASGGVSVDQALDELANLKQNEAYILINVDAAGNDARSVSGLHLADRRSGQAISVSAGQSGLQAIKVQAGTYTVASIEIAPPWRKNVLRRKFDRGLAGIEIEPQTITYIGDWTLSYGSDALVAGNRVELKTSGYSVSYDPKLLARFGINQAYLPDYLPVIAAINGNRLKGRWEFDINNAIAGISYY